MIGKLTSIDIHTLGRELKAKGVPLPMETRDDGFGWLALFNDADGYSVQLVQLASQTKSA